VGVWIVVGWLILALFGWAIGSEKARGAEGFWLTLLLGPLGLLITALLKSEADDGLKPCPACAERIQPNAKVCRFCGHEVVAKT
jgi:hypothetical protein